LATSYQDVYSRFLSKITDYNFLNLTENEIEYHLEKFLKSSIVKFRYCNKLSDRDDSIKSFNETLTDEEQEILSVLMCVEYLSPKILTDDLLKQTLSSKDYTLYSQANHIKEVRSIKDSYQKEASSLMILYTYSKTKMSGFK